MDEEENKNGAKEGIMERDIFCNFWSYNFFTRFLFHSMLVGFCIFQTTGF